jgi:hypothetical protein
MEVSNKAAYAGGLEKIYNRFDFLLEEIFEAGNFKGLTDEDVKVALSLTSKDGMQVKGRPENEYTMKLHYRGLHKQVREGRRRKTKEEEGKTWGMNPRAICACINVCRRML